MNNSPEYLELLQRIYWLLIGSSGLIVVAVICGLIYLGIPSDDIGDNA